MTAKDKLLIKSQGGGATGEVRCGGLAGGMACSEA